MSKKNIVLVDDEADVITFLQTVLEDHGYATWPAINAAEGLKLIKEHKPDLVCLDVLMPEESGISIFQKIKTDPDFQQLPVIILSGLNLSQDLEQVQFRKLADGTILPAPEGILEKPANAEQFLALVDKILG